MILIFILTIEIVYDTINSVIDMAQYIVATYLDEESNEVDCDKIKDILKQMNNGSSKDIVVVDLNHATPEMVEYFIEKGLIDTFVFSPDSIKNPNGSKILAKAIDSDKKLDRNTSFISVYNSALEQNVEDALSIGDIILNDGINSSLIHININDDFRIIGQTFKGIKNSAMKQREMLQKQENDIIDVAKRVVYNIENNKDEYTAQHIKSVALIAREIGRKMNLSDEELDMLAVGTLLHDIGKLDVSDSILKKNGRPTDDEWKQLKQHVTFGEIRLNEYNLGPYERAKVIAAQHHERYDGKGYPRGLKGNEIDILSSIASVADAAQAMFGRAYAQAKTKSELIEELRRCAGSQFNPDSADALCQVLDDIEAVKRLGLEFDKNERIAGYKVPDVEEVILDNNKRKQGRDKLPDSR